MIIEPLEIDGETSVEYKVYPLESARKSTSSASISLRSSANLLRLKPLSLYYDYDTVFDIISNDILRPLNWSLIL